MSKKKVKKRKTETHDDPQHYTLGSHYIREDFKRNQQQEIDSLPVLDPDSIHFDESKYDKTLYHAQSMDWIDYDTSSAMQERYSTTISPEYQQYSLDNAPLEPQPKHTFYAENAYKSNQHAIPHIENDNWGDTINTNRPQSPFKNVYSTSASADELEDEEMSDLHPSEGGDPRKFIENELKTQQHSYKEWKDNVTPENEPPLWNNALADRYEDKDNWWNVSSKYKYDMPHQALHGGVDKFDDESDVPLNSYWHKSTVSPDSWQMMKQRYRENMRPGSEEWNKWAFRTPVERKSLKWWPETLNMWFLRHETELLHSHEFRCKMMEHSALDEYWRLGELRWNRKLWEPYLRIGTWVVAPLLGAAATWWYRKAIGHRTRRQFDDEYKRWKQTCAVHEGDEHYMFSWRDSLQKRRPPPVVSPAMSVEEAGSRKSRSMEYHAERLIRGKPGDPY
eukprot:277129_1